MKKILLIKSIAAICLFNLTVLLTANAQPQRPSEEGGWQYSLGLGSMIKPKYKGSQNYDFWPIPYFDIKYGESFYLSPARGAGFQFETEGGIDYGLGLGFDFGRDEEDGELLRGMGEIDFGLLAKFDLGYTLNGIRLGLDFGQDISNVHGGYEVEVSIGKSFMVREWKSIINVKGFVGYASEDYLTTYFGVNSEQSDRTGYEEFNLDSQINEVGISGTWIRPINQDWSFLAMVRFTRLIGDSSDSPVVESDNQMFGGLFFVRKI